jgi:hypothetical protein
MREIFTSGSVGGAPGNRCFYPEAEREDHAPAETGRSAAILLDPTIVLTYNCTHENYS